MHSSENLESLLRRASLDLWIESDECGAEAANSKSPAPPDHGWLLRRLLDFDDYRWIREVGGARAERGLIVTRRRLFFLMLKKLRSEGDEFVKARVDAQSAPLDSIIEFEVRFRWLIAKMWIAGQLRFAGLHVEPFIYRAYADMRLLMAGRAPMPVSAIAG